MCLQDLERAMESSRAREPRYNTPNLSLLALSSCFALPLAKLNQKPEGKGASLMQPLRSASWGTGQRKEGQKAVLGEQTEITSTTNPRSTGLYSNGAPHSPSISSTRARCRLASP